MKYISNIISLLPILRIIIKKNFKFQTKGCKLEMKNRMHCTETLIFQKFSYMKLPEEFMVMSIELINILTDLSALDAELYIRPALLYRWRKEFPYKQCSSFPVNRKVILSAAEQELALLKNELRETQM